MPSNTESNAETNKINSYLTTFSDTLELGRNWEVGLTAISYTHSWFNIRPNYRVFIKSFNGDSKRTYCLDELYTIDICPLDRVLGQPIETGFRVVQRKNNHLKAVRPSNMDLSIFDMLPGYYRDIEELVRQINLQVVQAYAKLYGSRKIVPRLEYVPHLGRIRSISGRIVYEKPDGKRYIQQTFICFGPEDFANMLGTRDVWTPEDMDGVVRVNRPVDGPALEDNMMQLDADYIAQNFEGVTNDAESLGILHLDDMYSYLYPTAVDIRGGIHALCVYSDIVDLTIVGDHRVNLLRTVPVPKTAHFMEQLYYEFNHVHYLPVVKTELRNVQVYIKDESGTPIDFELGRVILTLHFRKKHTIVKGLSNE